MTWADIEKRIQRLNDLGVEFLTEIMLCSRGNIVLTPSERKVYVDAIKAAAAACEEARMALVRASVRMPGPGKL